MVARITTVAFQGIDALEVDVQVAIAPGIPAFTIVGLADKAVAESKERVRSALSSLGLSLPAERITINLSPADIQKEGSHYDLPIALGLLVALKIVPQDAVNGYIAMGELGLDGALREVSGVLPSAVFAGSHGKGLICPAHCGSEAAWSGLDDVLAAPSLVGLMNHFKGTQMLKPPEVADLSEMPLLPDFKDVKGQENAKRAFEIAAAGGHNFLMLGPPGAGKSMLSKRLPSILPPLSPEEALEVSIIHSVAGQLKGGVILKDRAFRAPHHSASVVSIVGGGLNAKPGELSLAHHGVLFLDEIPEFSRGCLETLRQPLESHEVHISRANAHVTYPCRVQVIAAMNPCKCGYLTEPELACKKAPICGQDYQQKLSGPLLDRFDLYLEMPALKPQDLMTMGTDGEASAVIRARVMAARDVQKQRFEDEGQAKLQTNAEAEGELLYKIAALDDASRTMLEAAVDQFHLSARGYHRILKVARTIADLEKSDAIHKNHIAEALSYRRMFYQSKAA